MKSLITFSLMLLVFGCDTLHNDVDIKSTKTLQLFVANNKSTVIDLQNIFPNYKNVSLANQNGVSYFNDRYIGYNSNSSSPSQFSFTVTNANNAKTLTNVITVGQTTLDCTAAAPFTYAKISNTSTLVVNLLNNPEFCNYNIHGGGEIGIADSQPGIDSVLNDSGVSIAICSCGGEGNTAILTYVPPSGFIGQVKFKYYLHAGADDSTPTANDPIYYDPKYSKYFSAHNVVIDVGGSSN